MSVEERDSPQRSEGNQRTTTERSEGDLLPFLKEKQGKPKPTLLSLYFQSLRFAIRHKVVMELTNIA